MDNFSSNGEDNRSVQRIIFEKATFGSFPTFFKVAGDDRNHPVQFAKHPHLTEIMFSDGTTIQVTASAGSTVIEEMVGPIPNNRPETYDTVETELGSVGDESADHDPWADQDAEYVSRNAPAIEPDDETPATEDALEELTEVATAVDPIAASVNDSFKGLLKP